MNPSDSPQLLIGDPDVAFLNSLRADTRAQSAPPLGATTPEQLEAVILDTTRTLSGVFVNPRLLNPMGVPLVRIARQHRPAVPIFLLLDDPSLSLSGPELRDLTIAKAVNKPVNFNEITRHLASVQLNFDPGAAVKQSQSHPDQLEVEVVQDDNEFLPIVARNFVAAQVSYFDVYVKVRPCRYVKILQSGDGFSPSRLQSYLDKRVVHFYLRKDTQENYLRFCDQLTASLLKNPNIPVAIKIEQTLNHGQETSNYLRNSGVDEKALRYCEKFTENVCLLLKSVDLQRSDVVKSYLGNLDHYEHGVATVMIAALVAIPLRFEMGKSLNTIGMAGMLHDIGLQGLGDKFADEDEQKMNEQEREIYQSHPIKGANILRELRGIEPVVVQAVEQHHERRNRKGFPFRLGSGNINRISEIIGISDEFARLIGRCKKEGTDPLRVMESTAFHGFSSPVITAFQMIFANRKGHA